jgi:hypothetical protein
MVVVKLPRREEMATDFYGNQTESKWGDKAGKIKDKVIVSLKIWHDCDWHFEKGTKTELHDEVCFVTILLTGDRFSCTMTSSGRVKEGSWRRDRN